MNKVKKWEWDPNSWTLDWDSGIQLSTLNILFGDFHCAKAIVTMRIRSKHPSSFYPESRLNIYYLESRISVLGWDPNMP